MGEYFGTTRTNHPNVGHYILGFLSTWVKESTNECVFGLTYPEYRMRSPTTIQ
jgi:hypothetical protein